jgi:hypothetical protein
MESNLGHIVGLIAQLWTIGWLLYAGWRVSGRLTHAGDAADRGIATAIVVLSACVVLNELLGSAGALTPRGIFFSHNALAAAGVVWGRSAARIAVPWHATAPASTLSYLTVATVVLVLPHAVRAIVHVPVAWDELNYHLLKPAVWLFDAQLSRLAFPFPLSWLAYYPANAELVWTTLVGVMRSDFLVHVLNVPLLLVLALLFVQFSRACGASSHASWAFALVMVTLPMVLGYVATAYVEIVLNVAELAAIWFALRWVRAESARASAEALLCGLASGLALGAKYAALPVIGTLAIALLGTLLTSERRRPRVLVEATIAACAALATGGFWFVRNAVETGNPFYPVPFLGLPHADNPKFPWNGFSILDNFMPLVSAGTLGSAWFRGSHRYFVAGPGMGWFGVVLIAVALLGVGSMAVASVQPRRATVLLGRAGAFVLLVAMLVTLITYLRLPYWGNRGWIVSQVRFFTPFLFLSVAAGVHLIERRIDQRVLFRLAAIGLLSNAIQLDLRYPQLAKTSSTLIAIVSLLAGSALVRFGKSPARLLPIAAAVVLFSLPFVFRWREQHRFEMLASVVEHQSSMHVPLVASAEYLARTYSERKVAVTVKNFEFLSVYTGRGFDVRPIYVMTHAGAVNPSEYPDGDPRHGADRDVWLRNLKASGAAALVVVSARSATWPTEREWIATVGIPERRFGDVAVYDLGSLRARSSTTESVALGGTGN